MTDPMLDLLDEATALLRNDLAKSLNGEQRYLALLAANAVATARREAELRPKLDEIERRIDVSIADIRAGHHDTDTDLFDTLRHRGIAQAWIADPANLDGVETEILSRLR